MIKKITLFILICFTSALLCPPVPIFAASSTGGLKIFSEIKGIKVYVDEELKGTDVIEIKDLEPGDHYVKITKDDKTLYSELVKVSAGATSAILIKSTSLPTSQPPVEVQQAADKFFKQQMQYKQEKIDILLSKNYQTVGTSNTTSTYFPGYYYYYVGTGYGTTTSTSTQYEVTDWKIIKGGVQEISDSEFANLIGDKDTQERMAKDWDNYNNTMNWGAWIGLTGIIMILAGGAAAFGSSGAAAESGAVVCAVGFIPTIIGLGMIGKNPPSGHYVNPGTAAKQAFEYNQALKKKLGLPESYEPR